MFKGEKPLNVVIIITNFTQAVGYMGPQKMNQHQEKTINSKAAPTYTNITRFFLMLDLFCDNHMLVVIKSIIISISDCVTCSHLFALPALSVPLCLN